MTSVAAGEHVPQVILDHQSPHVIHLEREQCMASLVLKMSVSLDGYVASADGSSDWVAAGRSPDGAGGTLETVSNAGTHLIGAATYARWAGFWPGAAGPFAQPMNEIPKVAFSDSLASADWGPRRRSPRRAGRRRQAPQAGAPRRVPTRPGRRTVRALAGRRSA